MFGTFDLSSQKSGWKTIGSLGKILTGSTPKTNVPEYWDGDIKWIAPAELTKDSFYIYDTERKITEEGRKSCSLNVLKPGVVLLSSRAPIGKVAIVGSEMYCNQGFKNIECGPELDSVYLYMLLKYNSEYLNSLGRGATFKEISAKIVAEVKIPAPPMELQNQFVNFVKQVDKSKLEFHRLIELYDSLIKSRFVEMFGTIDNPKVPFYKFGDVASFVNGYAFKPTDWGTEGLPIVRIQNLSGSGESYNYYSGKYPQNIELNKGDILVSWSATIGIFKWKGPKALLNQHIFKVYFDKMDINPTYFRVAADVPLQRATSQVHGSTMTHLTKKTFDEIEMPVPSKEVQDEFAKFVEQVDKSKFILTAHFTFLVIIWMKHRLIYYKPNTLHIRIICLSHSIAAFKWRIPLSLRHVKL